MSRPAFGTAPIKCGNRKCDWTGTERDLIPHPEDAGATSVRSVCPKCHCDNYSFPRRKGVATHRLVTEVVAAPARVVPPMAPAQFRAYQVELGDLTHKATAEQLCVSEVSVKRYATGVQTILPQTAKLLRALVLLRRLGKAGKLIEMD